MRKILFLFILVLLSTSNAMYAQITKKVYPSNNAGTFIAGDKEFLLNGKPFIIRASELHYTRIPKAYWNHRIKMCKAMGMNTICIYLFWNIHEQTPGIFDFTGQTM